MEVKTLHRRMVALLVGIALAACFVVATFILLPKQSLHDDTTDYGYVYSGAKSSSTGFVHSVLTDNTLVVLGSSEFSTPQRLVPQVPAGTFGNHNYNLHLMLVGEAFDQCLWDAIALGAMAKDGLPQNKVAVIVGLGQFTDGGLDASTFGARFSYSLYREFCSNGQIPQSLRDKVQRRLLEQGIDQTSVRSGNPSNPLEAIDGVVLGAMDDLKLRSQLIDVRKEGVLLASEPAQEPDWNELRDQAYSDACEKSTTNEWGVEDAFFTQQLEPALDSLKNARAGETYTNTPEYDDLELFLNVCDACGITPMVIIQPVLGPYYDHIGIQQETRDAAYNHIRSIVAAHESARLADFTYGEYEKYFMFDIVHFGWTGWIDAERALYEFAQEGN